MKIKRINLLLVILLVAGFALAGCGSDGDKASKGKAPGGNYASKTPDAGQPIDHSEVMGEYEARLKKNPKDWQALSGIGDSYFGLRRFNEAIDYYKQALAVNPDDIDSYNDLGLSYHYLGNANEGLKYIEQGIKAKPFYQRIWLTKGFILAYGAGDLEKARDAWEKTEALDSESQIGKAATDFLAQFKAKK
jgi:tetratricopeptide (TPR) repeat protein